MEGTIWLIANSIRAKRRWDNNVFLTMQMKFCIPWRSRHTNLEHFIRSLSQATFIHSKQYHIPCVLSLLHFVCGTCTVQAFFLPYPFENITQPNYLLYYLVILINTSSTFYIMYIKFDYAVGLYIFLLCSSNKKYPWNDFLWISGMNLHIIHHPRYCVRFSNKMFIKKGVYSVLICQITTPSQMF